DDDCLSEALQANLQNNAFKRSLGVSSVENYDDELFENLEANEDSGISSKKYKTLVAAVDAQSAKVDEISETLKQLVAKKGGDANVGSATAVAAGTKKVTVVTPEEATALSGAIAAVQQVRKQAESAGKGSTP
ncbi:hypothetical protein THAOC_29896, partial [Thalassiosira oceanica]